MFFSNQVYNVFLFYTYQIMRLLLCSIVNNLVPPACLRYDFTGLLLEQIYPKQEQL